MAPLPRTTLPAKTGCITPLPPVTVPQKVSAQTGGTRALHLKDTYGRVAPD